MNLSLFICLFQTYFCIAFQFSTSWRKSTNVMQMSKNSVPPMWKFVSKPLKEQARQWFIKRAILKGIDWKNLTDYYKLPCSMEELQTWKTRLEDKKMFYPEYFLQPFHGYDDGNMNWLAAQENEAASLSMSANYWSGVCAIDSEKWVRNNISYNVKDYIKYYGFCGRLDDFAVNSVKNILDVGCSGGISTEYIYKSFPKAQNVYGLDLSPYFVAVGSLRANKNNESITYVHANAEKTSFQNQSFDLIICNFLFHEVPQNATRVILEELNRLIIDGGIIAIVDLDPDILKNDQLLSQFRKWAFEVTEPHIYGYYNSNMTAYLEEHGFVDIVKVSNDPINAIWMGKKKEKFIPVTNH